MNPDKRQFANFNQNSCYWHQPAMALHHSVQSGDRTGQDFIDATRR